MLACIGLYHAVHGRKQKGAGHRLSRGLSGSCRSSLDTPLEPGKAGRSTARAEEVTAERLCQQADVHPLLPAGQYSGPISPNTARIPYRAMPSALPRGSQAGAGLALTKSFPARYGGHRRSRIETGKKLLKLGRPCENVIAVT
jgi:hypothetical protein